MHAEERRQTTRRALLKGAGLGVASVALSRCSGVGRSVPDRGEAQHPNPAGIAPDGSGNPDSEGLGARNADACERFVNERILHRYVEAFNAAYPEVIANAIPNSQAFDFLRANAPLLECPDQEIEEAYYFRWWTYRKHIKATPDGHVVTEFLPEVSWAKKHNTINCPVGHHFYEGRWLRDAAYLDEYAIFYFRKGGDPGGVSKVYTNWISDGIYARFLANGDRGFVVDLLDDLVANYGAWGRDGKPGDTWQASRLTSSGLYWQVDSWSGQEFSIGATGMRLPINSYLYGDAMAISRIAEMAGRPDLAEAYRGRADRLRSLVQDLLWDADAKFFKTRRLPEMPAQYGNPAAEDCAPGELVRVREIFGYVPWYFNLPEGGRGYEEAWRQLMEPRGFAGAYGPTVAERRHPNFRINTVGCQWCGASWPFSTSQTLTALANLLSNYEQDVVGRPAYFGALRAYALSHHWTREDGTVVPWVDESLNPDTGEWIVNWTESGAKLPLTRGRYYNHSTFCDLVITGLIGLRPRADDVVEVNPLVPEDTWDWFCLDSIPYHGVTLTIIWDRTGERYNRGKGLRVLADGKEIAHSRALSRVTGKL